MGNTTIGILAYADDLALFGNNLDTMNQHCRKLINIASQCGLKINDKKTEYVIYVIVYVCVIGEEIENTDKEKLSK